MFSLRRVLRHGLYSASVPPCSRRHLSSALSAKNSLDMGAAPAFLRPQSKHDKAEVLFKNGSCVPPPAKPVQVRDRYGLPGARHHLTNSQLPTHLAHAREGFPAVLNASCGEKSDEMVTEPRAAARELKRALDRLLPEHGVVMVYGLESVLRDATSFSLFMESIKSEYECTNFMEGRSMTSHDVAAYVRTGSDDHPAYTIEPHNEYNVAAKNRPRKLFLMCNVEPTDGGEWVISDATRIRDELPKNVLAKFAELGVRYEIHYPNREKASYNNWEDNIAPTRDAAEAYLTRAGCEWRWDDSDGSLLIYRVHPALQSIPDGPNKGELAWFNQIHAHHATFYKDCHPDFEDRPDPSAPWPVHTLYGDGSEIEESVLATIRRVVWESSVAVPMSRGCLMVVDNYRALHGRMGFTPGTPRETLVSIIYA